MVKKFASLPDVVAAIDVTGLRRPSSAEKNVNAHGIDAHIVVVRKVVGSTSSGQLEAISVFGDNKHSQPPNPDGKSKLISGQPSSFANDAKNDFEKPILDIANAFRAGKFEGLLTAEQVRSLVEQTQSGIVLYDIGTSGYNTGISDRLRQKSQASVTQFDNFADAQEHRERIEWERAWYKQRGARLPRKRVVLNPMSAEDIQQMQRSGVSRGGVAAMEGLALVAGYIIQKAGESTQRRAFEQADAAIEKAQPGIDKYQLEYPEEGVLVISRFQVFHPNPDSAVTTYFQNLVIQMGSTSQAAALQKYVNTPVIETSFNPAFEERYVQLTWYPPILGEK